MLILTEDTEANIVSTSKLNEKWGQSILLHGNATVGEMDDNNDTFLDRPKGNQINATYLLDYNDLENSGFSFTFWDSIFSEQKNCRTSWF